MPRRWIQALLCSVYKKGEKTVRGNWRGIAVLDVVCMHIAYIKLNVCSEKKT